MKWKLNIIKNIVTPVEVEADDLIDAVKKAYETIPEIDTDHGKVGYMVDTTPSDSQIEWYKDQKGNKNRKNDLEI
jgi:hypothetical protein